MGGRGIGRLVALNVGQSCIPPFALFIIGTNAASFFTSLGSDKSITSPNGFSRFRTASSPAFSTDFRLAVSLDNQLPANVTLVKQATANATLVKQATATPIKQLFQLTTWLRFGRIFVHHVTSRHRASASCYSLWFQCLLHSRTNYFSQFY